MVAPASEEDVKQDFLVVELGSDSRKNSSPLLGLHIDEQVGVSLLNEEMMALRRVKKIYVFKRTSLGNQSASPAVSVHYALFMAHPVLASICLLSERSRREKILDSVF